MAIEREEEFESETSMSTVDTTEGLTTVATRRLVNNVQEQYK